MVKTLRITSVLIGALALVMLSFSVAYGIKGDPEVRDLIEVLGPVEQFEKDQGRAAARRTAQSKPPLVVEAEFFARLLNPPIPRPPKPDPRIGGTGEVKPPPVPVTAKFDLVATCFNATDPNRSYACVDEPGKGPYWVGVNEKIGRHVVRTIRSGEIILWNGREDETLRVPQKVRRSLLKGEGGIPTQPISTVMQSRTVPSQPNSNPLKQSGQPRPSVNVRSNAASKMTSEQRINQMQQIMEKIKNIDTNTPDLSEEGRKARETMMTELMERARHMGPQEAGRLRQLGTRSTIDVEPDPNGDQIP